MAFFHGVKTSREQNAGQTIRQADSGICLAIGTAPSHTIKGGGERIIMASSFNEASVKAGYSDDWAKYTLCEAMYAFFKVYGAGPLIMINAAAGADGGEAVTADAEVINGKAELCYEAIRDTIAIEGMEEGKDYEIEYEDGKCVIKLIKSAASVNVTYKAVQPVTEGDIIKAIDEADRVYAKYGIIPDIFIAPGWSRKAEVANALAAKTDKINEIFKGGAAMCDIEADTLEKAIEEKKKNFNSPNEYVCWPKVRLGERVLHLSTAAAGLTASHDSEIGTPSESPSNLPLKMSAAVKDDGTEVLLTMGEGNLLNAAGIATALSFMGGLKLWGNTMASYPDNLDESEYFINMHRMRRFVENTLILTHWARVDRNQTKRLIDNVIDTTNIWLNGLTSAGALPGGSSAALDEDNTKESIAAGKTKYRVKLGMWAPNQVMEFVTEYDAEIAAAALGI